MNIAQRLFLVAGLLISCAGIYLVYVAQAASEWELTEPIRRASAHTEALRASTANDAVAIMRAKESQRSASMTADERFQTQRYLGYGLLGAGVLFGLVGFVVGGAKAAPKGDAQATA